MRAQTLLEARWILLILALAAVATLSITGGTLDRTIENEWVSATPKEFADNIKKLLSLDHVKSSILSLMSPTPIVVPSESASQSTDPQQSRQGDEDEEPVE